METKPGLNRRQFIGVTADAAMLGVLAATFKPLAAFAGEGGSTTTFYDPRFPAARTRALELAGTGPLRAINGDPTDAVLQNLRAMRLQGVTTESVPFCLRQCAPHARLRQRRIDRDLFEWHFEARS